MFKFYSNRILTVNVNKTNYEEPDDHTNYEMTVVHSLLQ